MAVDWRGLAPSQRWVDQYSAREIERRWSALEGFFQMGKKIPADVSKVRERVKGAATVHSPMNVDMLIMDDPVRPSAKKRAKAPRAKAPRAKAPRAKKRAARDRGWRVKELIADLDVQVARAVAAERERDGYQKAVEECLAQDAAMKKELSRLTLWLEEDRQRLNAANSVVEAQAKRIEELKASAPVLYVRELEAERGGLLAAAKQRSADYTAACRRLEASEKSAQARIEELTAQNLRLVDELVEAKKGGVPDLSDLFARLDGCVQRIEARDPPRESSSGGELAMAFATIGDLRKELCDLRSAIDRDMGILSVEVQDGCLVFSNGRRLACEVRSKGQTYTVPSQNRFVLHDASLAPVASGPDGKDWAALVDEWREKFRCLAVEMSKVEHERDGLLASQADHLRQIEGLQAALAPARADRDAAFIELRAACEKTDKSMLQEAYDRLRKEREAIIVLPANSGGLRFEFVAAKEGGEIVLDRAAVVDPPGWSDHPVGAGRGAGRVEADKDARIKELEAELSHWRDRAVASAVDPELVEARLFRDALAKFLHPGQTLMPLGNWWNDRPRAFPGAEKAESIYPPSQVGQSQGDVPA